MILIYLQRLLIAHLLVENHLQKKQETEEHRSIPLNYRNFLGAAYRVFEEETLVKIDGKEMNTHMGSMLNQCKQKQASQGDKLMLKLRGLLDYVPKTYKNWERSKMQKMFHRNFMQATCLHLYRHCIDTTQILTWTRSCA